MNEQVNGAYCTIVSMNADRDRAHLRVYTHTREGRFMSVGMLRISEQHLRALLAEIERVRLVCDQPMLPPWDTTEADNVRFLPPER